MQGNLAAVARALAFVLVALALCGVIFQLAGYSAVEMFQSIADGAFLNPNAWQGSLRWAILPRWSCPWPSRPGSSAARCGRLGPVTCVCGPARTK